MPDTAENQFIQSLIYKVNQFNKNNNLEEASHPLKVLVQFRGSYFYDAAITISDRIIAVIEFKPNLKSNMSVIQKIAGFAIEDRINYVVLSDGREFYVFDTFTSNTTLLDFERFIELICDFQKTDRERLLNAIYFLDEKFKDRIFLNCFDGSCSDLLAEDLFFDEEKQFFKFKNEDSLLGFEKRVLDILVPPLAINKVYRYTTMESAFKIIESGKFRLNGIVCMNDKSELNATDRFVGKSTSVGVERVKEYNGIFISCFSTLKDNLNLWRLYGDDAKGVCLEFTIRTGESFPAHLIRDVQYLGENCVAEKIEKLNNIFIDFQNNFKRPLRMKIMEVLPYFFKDSDYESENEVRVLSKSDAPGKHWFVSEPNIILTPFIEIELNSAEPLLKLTEIMLGPKASEKTINRDQFEHFLAKNKTSSGDCAFEGLSVTLSRINNYR